MSFRVHGIVVEADTGHAMPGVLVRVYDKDLVLDDFLGECRADRSGLFEVRFTEEAFRDLFEKKPDLYLLVFDPSGKLLLLSTERAIRFGAGRDEHFELRVPPERTRRS